MMKKELPEFLIISQDEDGKVRMTKYYYSHFDYPNEKLENYQFDEHKNVIGWHSIEDNNDGMLYL